MWLATGSLTIPSLFTCLATSTEAPTASICSILFSFFFVQHDTPLVSLSSFSCLGNTYTSILMSTWCSIDGSNIYFADLDFSFPTRADGWDREIGLHKIDFDIKVRCPNPRGISMTKVSVKARVMDRVLLFPCLVFFLIFFWQRSGIVFAGNPLGVRLGRRDMYHMLMLPPNFREEVGTAPVGRSRSAHHMGVAEVGPIPAGSRSARHMGEWRQPKVRWQVTSLPLFPAA